MQIEFIRGSIERHDIRTRMPFKYGIATMTDLPHVFVKVSLLIDGSESTGQSADHLPPKWFTKDPDASVETEIADMEASIRQALDAAKAVTAETPFAFWSELYQRLMSPPRFPALLQHFGISLVERAMLDAVCRHARTPLWKLIHEDRLGIDLGSLSPELSGVTPADFLPKQPLDSVNLRHTVGMADFLREADIPECERLDDGLPQSLEACIARYGLREFKLKLSGQPEADLSRLRDIAAVVTEKAPADFCFSLDGNEQFATPEQLHTFGEQVYNDVELAAFFGHLLFIEQPINRKVALGPEARRVDQAWPRPVPIIIDESDGALEDFPRALELGYAGVSHKNCKGVFKGLRNRALIAYHQYRHPERTFLMTGEDLANIGPNGPAPGPRRAGAPWQPVRRAEWPPLLQGTQHVPCGFQSAGTQQSSRCLPERA
jgi:L-alanine-DL-glutamate epimerase-like enolase superfamily enzyme